MKRRRRKSGGEESIPYIVGRGRDGRLVDGGGMLECHLRGTEEEDERMLSSPSSSFIQLGGEGLPPPSTAGPILFHLPPFPRLMALEEGEPCTHTMVPHFGFVVCEFSGHHGHIGLHPD